MTISAVAFDLDDTLAPSKSAVSPEMAQLLIDLGRLVPVCIISGGRYEQFREQLLAYLPASPLELASFHLMPTCGTRYYRHGASDWELVYAEDLADDEKRAATAAIETSARALGLWEPDDAVVGERIEDRGSQITFSALGQLAPLELKRAWDPGSVKRNRLQQAVQELLPSLEVRAGGSTSIDITRKGIDKAYGLRQFAEIVGLEFGDILFVGDRLEPGGNDHPVVSLGVQTHAVEGCEETLAYLPSLIEGLRSSPAEL